MAGIVVVVDIVVVLGIVTVLVVIVVMVVGIDSHPSRLLCLLAGRLHLLTTHAC